NIMVFFIGKKKEFKSVRRYFSYLLTKYRLLNASGKHEISLKDKTQYQDQDTGLQKVNFRPDPADWSELRVIANSYGISMCKLFSRLLLLDHAGVEPTEASEGLPTHFPKKIMSLSFLGTFFCISRQYNRSFRFFLRP
ncbi:MAG: DUF1564 domain-containing protein, partial [Leptospira sp.]|nr:DUF1564 domain-containing protein [Leptospira sp.]